MDVSKLFTDSVNVLKLRKQAMSDVLNAPMSHSFFILGLMSVLAALGYVFFPVRPFEGVVYRPDFLWIVGRALGNFVFYFLSFSLIGLISDYLLRSKISARGFFSLMCHASLAGFMLLIPALFPAVVIWYLFVMHEALNKLGKLGTGAIIFLLCIQFVFSLFLGYTYFPFLA